MATEKNCKKACLKIAIHIQNSPLKEFEPQSLSNLANTFSKWPEEENCKKACLKIAIHIQKSTLKDFNSQNLSNLNSAFSKWYEEENCREACLNIAKELSENRQLDDFYTQGISSLSKSFRRLSKKSFNKA